MSERSLWTARDSALIDLKGPLLAEAEALSAIFQLLDEILEDFERFYVDSKLAAIAVIVATKGRNLALGLYSLALDGLAQESGALLRPLLEVIELLAYLRIEPDGARQAESDELPTPGERARRVDGNFREVRNHLSANACHVSISSGSLKHCVNSADGRLRIVQPHNTKVLRRNMGSVHLFVGTMTREASLLFGLCSDQCTDALRKATTTAEARRARVALLNNRGRALFHPEVLTGERAMVEIP